MSTIRNDEHEARDPEFAALEDHDTLAGRLFTEAPLPWLVVAHDGTIVHANLQTEETFGWSRRELVGQRVEMLVPLKHRAAHPARREQFVAAPRARAMGSGFEVKAVRRHGSELFVDVQLSPFTTQRGRYTMAILRDVTARHEEAERVRELAERLAAANDDLRAQAAALSKLDAEKNALLGMAAHDLRSPLSVVLGYAELLTTVAASDPIHEHREVLDVIVRTARLMRRILDDLLDWSAIESGTLRLASYPVDPVNLAADAMALAGLAAARRRIALSLEAEPGLPPVDVDPERIGQVLGNLLGNALKYSPDGQPVRVRVTRNGDESVEFAVIDRGQGIAPEFVSHMFKPFETGGNTPADGERAVGLGLAIVKRIVDAHGGTVMLESTPGEGSTFRVPLPIVHRSMSTNGA